MSFTCLVIVFENTCPIQYIRKFIDSPFKKIERIYINLKIFVVTMSTGMFKVSYSVFHPYFADCAVLYLGKKKHLNILKYKLHLNSV
jgi:hypothetical protein